MLLDYKSGWTKILKISDKDALSLISALKIVRDFVNENLVRVDVKD